MIQPACDCSAPLKQYGAGTTAKDVGIIGIGGLGHFGLLFAKGEYGLLVSLSFSLSWSDRIVLQPSALMSPPSRTPRRRKPTPKKWALPVLSYDFFSRCTSFFQLIFTACPHQATHGAEDAFKPYRRSLDLIIATTNDSKMPLTGYLSLLRPGGHLIREWGLLAVSPLFPLTSSSQSYLSRRSA